jgi:hypothetical protein
MCGRANASLEVSSHGAQNNSILQAHAKGAECAFCLWAGIDPLTALNWAAKIDRGFDVFWSQRRIDIKHTANGRFLIWPINKREFLTEKPIDVLVTGARIFAIPRAIAIHNRAMGRQRYVRASAPNRW